MALTFLRDDLYADVLPEMVGPDGVLRGPAADGPVAAVALADVADAATTVLLRPGEHRGALLPHGTGSPHAHRGGRDPQP